MRQTQTRGLFWLLAIGLLGSACSDYLNSKQIGPANLTNGIERSGQPAVSASADPFPAGYDPLEGEYSDAKFMASLGVHVIAPLASDFRFQAEALERAVASACSALAPKSTESAETDTVDTAESMEPADPKNTEARAAELSSAQSAWEEVMLTFHKLSVLGLDPVKSRALDIYSWPALGLCPIDQNVAMQKNSLSELRSVVYTQRGLAAIEYLLFAPASSSACPVANPRFKQVREWLEKPMQERLRLRCEHARSLSRLVTEQAKAVEAEWGAAEGNFSKRWSEGRAHGSVQAAMNALSNGLFFLERLKYDRLGRPLGVRDCDEVGPCPHLVEHSFSGLSLKAARAQLEAALVAFQGPRLSQSSKRGWSLSDAIAAVGTTSGSNANVSASIISALETALESIETGLRKGAFDAQIRAMGEKRCTYRASAEELKNEPQVCSVFQSVRRVVDLIKTDFLMALSLRAPPTFQGDAD